MGTKVISASPDYTNMNNVFAKRCMLTTSTGSVLLISLGDAGTSDMRTISIYESTDRVSFTQRYIGGQGIMSVGGQDGIVAADLYPNNDVGILIGGGSLMYYFKFTYGTWGAPTIAETIDLNTLGKRGTGRYMDGVDFNINEAGIPTFMYLTSPTGAAISGTTTDGVSLVCASRISGAWSMSALVPIVPAGTTIYSYSMSLSFQYMHSMGSGVVTNRPVVIALTYNTATGGDQGTKVYTATLSDLSSTITGMTLRTTVMPNVLPNGYQSYWESTMKKNIVAYTGTNEWTIGITAWDTAAKKFVFGVMRGTWDGTTWAITVGLATTNVTYPDAVIATSSWPGEVNMSSMIVGGGGNVLFPHLGQELLSGSARYQAKLTFAKISGGAVTWYSTSLFTDNQEALSGVLANNNHQQLNMYYAETAYYIQGDVSKNARLNNRFDALLRLRGNSSGSAAGGQWYFNLNPTLPAPGPVGPASASTQTTSEPNVYADMTALMIRPPTHVKIEWQFAKDSGFTTSLRTYLQADAKYTAVINTQTAGVYVRMNDVLPLAQALVPSGTWYVRARQVSLNGIAGAWTAGQSFTVSHAPVATPVSPTGFIVLQYSTGIFNFAWTFSDAYPNDSQTAYQVVCERDDTGGTIFDTGKITSTSFSYNGTIPAIYKDIVLRWKVRVWDTSDVAGAYSSYSQFRVADPPAITTNYPENGGTVLSAIPYVEATPTTTGGRVITNYKVVVTKNGSPHYDTGWLTPSSPIPSGQKIIWSTSAFSYTLNDDYSVVVYVRDNLNLEVASAPVYYDTDWDLPSTPAPVRVDSSKYNTEGYGHVIVQWDGVSDLNLYGWILERRIGIPATLNTFIFEDWEEVYRTTENLTLYEYDDVMVPSGCQVEYRLIKQLVLLGSISNSLPTAAVNAYVESDGYWLIDPTAAVGTIRAFKLANVTSESYSDEYEEAEFNLIGRGRHVDQGDRLGYKGQLVAQLRDSMTSTARAKKLILEDLKKQSGYVYLRNPFGDVFMVYLSTLQVSRISGVGRSEFVDVTIPYSEVS